MDLSVVIPLYNERDNVAPLVAEIRAALDGVVAYEVIAVDDGSDDGTGAKLREIASAWRGLRIVRHVRNFGQSAAIWSGVRAARAAWIVTLDGDGQNDPMEIPRLLAVRDDPSSPPALLLVCGYRRLRKDGWVKRFSSRVANAVRSRILGDRTPDTGCGLKLFPRDAFLLLPYFDHMHRFLPALFQRQGGAVVSVEVRHRPRRHGKSSYHVGDRLWIGIVDMLGVLWLKRRGKFPITAAEE